MAPKVLYLLAFAALSVALVGGQQLGYTQYVDPFYGTEGGGNMFPGVVAGTLGKSSRLPGFNAYMPT